MSFSLTGSPSKHTESSLETPPNALQKSAFDCQNWVSSLTVEFTGIPAWPCNEGTNGEFDMETFSHVSHKLEQKSLVTWIKDWDEFAEGRVELHSIGTGLGTDATVNSSAANGSHL